MPKKPAKKPEAETHVVNIACVGGKPPPPDLPPADFMSQLTAANQTAMRHMDSQSQLQVAMAVLTMASHCEHLSQKFDDCGILDQAVAIVKVMLFTGPLAEKVRHSPVEG